MLLAIAYMARIFWDISLLFCFSLGSKAATASACLSGLLSSIRLSLKGKQLFSVVDNIILMVNFDELEETNSWFLDICCLPIVSMICTSACAFYAVEVVLELQGIYLANSDLMCLILRKRKKVVGRRENNYGLNWLNIDNARFNALCGEFCILRERWIE